MIKRIGIRKHVADKKARPRDESLELHDQGPGTIGLESEYLN